MNKISINRFFDSNKTNKVKNEDKKCNAGVQNSTQDKFVKNSETSFTSKRKPNRTSAFEFLKQILFNSACKKPNTIKLVPNEEYNFGKGTVLRIGNTDFELDNLLSLTGKTVTIGRKSGHSADILIDDNSVSAKHLQVTITDNGYIIKDLNSKFGTELYTTRKIAESTSKPKISPLAQKYKNGQMSKQDWEDVCFDEYLKIRGGLQYAKDYGAKNWGDTNGLAGEISHPSNQDTEILPENGWNYRYSRYDGLFFQEALGDRMSLNVKADVNMIRELDTLMTTGTYVDSSGQRISIGSSGQFYYKTYDDVSKWGSREDPVTVYCKGEASAQLQEAIKDITKKYQRGSLYGHENSPTPWYSLDKNPNADMIVRLANTAAKYDKKLAALIAENYNKRENMSAGYYMAFCNIVNEYQRFLQSK